MAFKARDEDLDDTIISQPLVSLPIRYTFLCKVYRARINLGGFQITDDGFQAFYTRFDELRQIAVPKCGGATQDCTYRRLVDIIELLRTPGASRAEVKRVVSDRFTVRLPISPLIDLAASLLSLVFVSGPVAAISYDDPVIWDDTMILGRPMQSGQVSLIETIFRRPPSGTDSVKLPQSFTAAHLEKIGGIQIRWTHNLADHLLLRDDDTRLMLYHHVSVLQLQDRADSILPAGLAEETIRTMSLLMPPSLGKANAWFQQEQRKHRLDTSVGQCDRLNSSERQIDNFHFWRERLVLLKRTYDEAEPRSLSQLWWDDRKKTQWLTFWVAVLVFLMTIFFGVIQSVASIVQAWASVKALRTQN
ncbi:MAG: hypothetical protein Q9197_004090 [Variospora fuerteventurae]